MQRLLPGMVDPVVTTIQGVKDNIAMLRMTETSGVFCVAMGDGDRSAVYQLAGDISAFLWTKEMHQQLQESLQGRNSTRCQVCGAPAAEILACSCGTYAWCQDCEGEPVPGGSKSFTYIFGEAVEYTTTFYEILWDHADHDCFPACCALEHKRPCVEPEELEEIVRVNRMPDEIFLTEDQASSDDRIIFHVKVRRKSREELAHEEKQLRSRFDVNAWPPEADRLQREREFIERFLRKNT